tara:strand:- start:8272 stop:8508 length:237 start_codon:yes stop_codon:yes gene_type:complete
MIEIFRTDTEGKPYYEGDSIVYIMVAQILHIRKCGECNALITEIVTMAPNGYNQLYYTITLFEQIKSDVHNALKNGGV